MPLGICVCYKIDSYSINNSSTSMPCATGWMIIAIILLTLNHYGCLVLSIQLIDLLGLFGQWCYCCCYCCLMYNYHFFVHTILSLYLKYTLYSITRSNWFYNVKFCCKSGQRMLVKYWVQTRIEFSLVIVSPSQTTTRLKKTQRQCTFTHFSQSQGIICLNTVKVQLIIF